LVLPESIDPQGYGQVVSCTEFISNETKINVGDYLVFHPMAGMDIVLKKQIMKVLKCEEIYGILEDEEIIGTLEALKIGGETEGTKIIQSVSNGRIIQ